MKSYDEIVEDTPFGIQNCYLTYLLLKRRMLLASKLNTTDEIDLVNIDMHIKTVDMQIDLWMTTISGAPRVKLLQLNWTINYVNAVITEDRDDSEYEALASKYEPLEWDDKQIHKIM